MAEVFDQFMKFFAFYNGLYCHIFRLNISWTKFYYASTSLIKITKHNTKRELQLHYSLMVACEVVSNIKYQLRQF
jgi:hypothetical protein